MNKINVAEMDSMDSMRDTLNRIEAIKGKLRNKYNKPGSIKWKNPVKRYEFKVKGDAKAIDAEEYKQASKKLYSRSWLLLNLAQLFPKHTSKTGTLWLIINNSSRVMYSLPLLRHLLKSCYRNNFYVTDDGKLRKAKKQLRTTSNEAIYNSLVALEKLEPEEKLTWKQRNAIREASEGCRIIGQVSNRTAAVAPSANTWIVQFNGESIEVDPNEVDLDSPKWIGKEGMQYLAEMLNGKLSRTINRARHVKAVRYFRRIFQNLDR